MEEKGSEVREEDEEALGDALHVSETVAAVDVSTSLSVSSSS